MSRWPVSLIPALGLLVLAACGYQFRVEGNGPTIGGAKTPVSDQPAPRLQVGGEFENRCRQKVHLVVNDQPPVVCVKQGKMRELAAVGRIEVREVPIDDPAAVAAAAAGAALLWLESPTNPLMVSLPDPAEMLSVPNPPVRLSSNELPVIEKPSD